MNNIQQQWFGNIRGDVLAGLVVGLALIPESLAFAFILGVDPRVALYASFLIAVITSFVGGRPGLISAATGAMALVLVSLVANHGVEYMLAATILTGIIQWLLGTLGIANYMRFIPNAVMLGFVNALGILIFLSQLPYLMGGSAMTYTFAFVTLALIYLIPKRITTIPAPLIAIVIMSIVAVWSGVPLQVIGDLGQMPTQLPHFLIPEVPFTLETFRIILPYSLALAVVGLLETLLSSQVVDDLTDTTSDKKREARGQGIANLITGFFGGMAGCALIGQSIINIQSGGRGRLSTLTAGVFLMLLIVFLGDWVAQIPMPVLVGVMIMVSFTTFNWQSFRFLKQAPLSESIVMLLTVGIILITHNLAIGVVVGVIVSSLVFVANISKLTIREEENEFFIEGPLFFASTTSFLTYFQQKEMPKQIILNFEESQLWDESAIGALLKIINQWEQQGMHVELKGLNHTSQQLYHKFVKGGTT